MRTLLDVVLDVADDVFAHSNMGQDLTQAETAELVRTEEYAKALDKLPLALETKEILLQAILDLDHHDETDWAAQLDKLGVHIEWALEDAV
ncbi:MAG: hypothetical protein WDA42_09225 [Candidatus Bathyarchaeia archaeon]